MSVTTTIVKTFVGGTCVATGLYIGYDYKTCHPMRKMQLQGYNVNGAFIRFHNTLIKNKFLSTPSFTLKELSNYNGSGDSGSSPSSKSKSKIYFSSDGWIWDVTESETFQDTYGLWKGKDASIALAKMSMNPKDVNRIDWENLTDTDLESLQSWTDYFSEKYYIKGQLKEYNNNNNRRR